MRTVRLGTSLAKTRHGDVSGYACGRHGLHTRVQVHAGEPTKNEGAASGGWWTAAAVNLVNGQSRMVAARRHKPSVASRGPRRTA
jgi:hypothetical protein